MIYFLGIVRFFYSGFSTIFVDIIIERKKREDELSLRCQTKAIKGGGSIN